LYNIGHRFTAGNSLLTLTIKAHFNFSTFIIVDSFLLVSCLLKLDRLEHIHSCGFVFRDVKPHNFLTGYPNEQNKKVQHTIYVVDFGIAHHYSVFGQHTEMEQKLSKDAVMGTARFASLNAHKGITLSRRDDLESLAYMLIYFLVGELPWSSIQDDPITPYKTWSAILPLKEGPLLAKLCKNIPKEFMEFLSYAQKLEFEEKPDYRHWRNKFGELLKQTCKKNGIDVDNVTFDWEDKMVQDGLSTNENEVPKRVVVNRQQSSVTERSSTKSVKAASNLRKRKNATVLVEEKARSVNTEIPIHDVGLRRSIRLQQKQRLE